MMCDLYVNFFVHWETISECVRTQCLKACPTFFHVYFIFIPSHNMNDQYNQTIQLTKCSVWPDVLTWQPGNVGWLWCPDWFDDIVCFSIQFKSYIYVCSTVRLWRYNCLSRLSSTSCVIRGEYHFRRLLVLQKCSFYRLAIVQYVWVDIVHSSFVI